MRLRGEGMGWRRNEVELVVPDRIVLESRVLLKRERNHGEVVSTLEYFIISLFRIEKVQIQFYFGV